MLESHWAAALSFGLTTMLILLLIPLARHLRLVDHPDERKRHATPTPLVGGLAMSIGVAVSLAVAQSSPEALGPFLAGAALLVTFGLIDDARDINYRIRFAVQAAAASILIFWGGIRIESLGDLVGLGRIDLGPFAIPFTIFAIVGLINAINMLDGLDGLAGGVTLATLVPVLAYCQLRGLNQVMLPGQVLGSSIAAFLVFNYRFPWRKKALVFMGDAGSNFLGFALAWIMLSLNQDQSAGLSPIAVLWVVGFPVADTLLTMWRRHRKGLSAFHPDREHVHYVLQRAGFGVNATVLIVSGLSALCAVIGLVAALDGVPEPLLTLGLLAVLASHNQLLARAWRITKKFRHLLTVPQRSDD